MLTYKKTEAFAGYKVYVDGVLQGVIRKVEHWTVRGTRIGWQAFYKGGYQGEGATRNEATKFLVKE